MMVKSIIYQLLFASWISNTKADSTTYDFGTSFSAVGCAIGLGPGAIIDSYGFDIRIFKYDFETLEGYDQDYMTHGYTYNTLQYSLTGVTDINFSGVIPESEKSAPYESTLFGKTFEVSNFAAEFTTYFDPIESGFYKFELDNTDDSAMIFVGAPNALKCCTAASDNDFNIVSSSSYSIFTSGHSANNQFAYQYLSEYYLYPIRIIYVNMDSEYTMQFKITNPDGTVVSEFGGNRFRPASHWAQAWFPQLCHANTFNAPSETVFTSWTGKTTSHSTFTPSTGYDAFTEYQYNPDPTTTVTAHYHDSTVSSTIVTPTGAGTWIESIFYPEETVTSYVPWTGNTTLTSTTIIPEDAEIPATVVIGVPDAITTTTIAWTGAETSSTTIYPADGQNGTITVEILTPRKTDTSYVPWTGTETVTSTTLIPENLEISATVVVGVPDAITTTTNFWTGTETSSTTIYPVDGKNGTIIVEVFNPRDVTTSTNFWTGSFISTYTTFFPENSNGTITVGVEIPRSTKIVTDFWSGSTTSYVTESPSKLDNEVIVHEYVAQSTFSDGVVYITTYWTGDFTTYSTVNPGYSNETTTVLVDIPQQIVTKTWSGTVTSTSFYCPDNGTASTPIVLIPNPTVFSDDCEACRSPIISSSLAPSVDTSVSSSGSAKSLEFSSTSDSFSESFKLSSTSSTESLSSSESTELSYSVPYFEIAYSNPGSKLVFHSLILLVPLLFSFYII